MARIAGVNIPQNKLVHVGLTYIYGIGDKFSNKICKALEIPKSKRVNELSDDQILKIREFIDKNFSVEGIVLKSIDKGLMLFWLLWEKKAVRISPPLTITEKEIKKGCAILKSVIDEVCGC